MNEILYRILVFIAGLVLGTLFFGGLWLTVKKTVASKTPALWVFGSFIFRVSITMLGFYYIASGNWQRLVICLLGFTMARFGVVRLTKTLEEKQLLLKKEGSNEA